MSNSNTNLKTQSSNALHNAIMEAGSKDRPPMLALDIRNQLNAEAEAVQIILTGIDNDIYSTVDACSNACEMWKAIERLKQGEPINVQDLETNLYWEFRKFTSWDGESLELYYLRFYKMVNEFVRNQCHVTNHYVNVQFLLELQPEWQRECQKPKRVKDAAYHKEKMLLYKQEEAGVQLNAEQADWKDDTDDESDDQNWKHIICTWHRFKRLLQIQLTILDQSLMMIPSKSRTIRENQKCYTDDLDKECDLLASLIQKLKCEIDDSKNRNKFLESSNNALVDKLK
ncbi:hypothetical protein Tco_1000346, partial [Tanacetum coccineum]